MEAAATRSSSVTVGEQFRTCDSTLLAASELNRETARTWTWNVRVLGNCKARSSLARTHVETRDFDMRNEILKLAFNSFRMMSFRDDISKK
eukprot:733783-Pelagomonas_calceolata.AAC.3